MDCNFFQPDAATFRSRVSNVSVEWRRSESGDPPSRNILWPMSSAVAYKRGSGNLPTSFHAVFAGSRCHQLLCGCLPSYPPNTSRPAALAADAAFATGVGSEGPFVHLFSGMLYT